jgi:diguanylate cyclase (GGDEF)-like protein/PAS domain S-box-containing protein
MTLHTPRPAAKRKTPIRLLLVEDDAVDRLACRRALAQHPDYEFVLIEAETGRQGIQLALDQQPDLVLLDYHLPDLNGLEFLAELRDETGVMPVPVMMLTGTDNVAVAVEAMRHGARDYLVKDTERNHLQLLPAVIERVLREQRLHAEKRTVEAKYRTLVEQIPAITYVAALDVPGKLLYVSPQVQTLGFSPDEWLADPEGLLKQVLDDDRAAVRAAFAKSYETGEPLRCEYRMATRAGEIRWCLAEAALVHDEDGAPLFLQGVLVDITEDKRREAELEAHRRRLEELVGKRTAQLEKQADLLKAANANLIQQINERQQAEQALRASEARFRLLIESAGEGIYGLDREGRCTFVNDAALEMLGYTRTELIGRDTHSLIHHTTTDGSPYSADDCRIYDAFRLGTSHRGLIELLWRKDGSSFPAEYSVQPLRADGQLTGAVLVFHDVSEAQALARRLAHQATHDALTGLTNRREFETRLERVLHDLKHETGAHALCYLDLDQFKVVNDTCGHAAGDQLLRQLSARLQEHMRARDTFARLGGDEFGVLLEHCPFDQAVRIATGLRDVVQDFRFTWDGKPFSIGVSIGLVPLDATTESAASALSAADAACYAAKEQGRNRVQVLRPDDAAFAARRAQMHWVSRLTHALDENRFRLYVQPITPLATSAPAHRHYEVLLRLIDEDGHEIEPGAFLPAAERYNLMPAIDRWVVRAVIRGVAARHCGTPAGELPMYAINLSGGSFSDDRLVEFVRTELAAEALPPQALCFEITETAAIANLEHARHFIAECKRLGCRFALDDFGRGMSSFAYLKALPVDFIKIDGDFVKSVANDRVNRAIAEAINQVAHVLAIQTVAECTEDLVILGAVTELGIDHAQGYALGLPRPFEELGATEPAPRVELP